MFDTDLSAFGRMLEDIWGLKTQTVTPGQMAMYFRALQRYPLEQVRAGLDAHICDPQRGRFLPMPADVIAQIEGLAEQDGRPGPEEAWALVLKGRDEAQTITWTAEMAEAMGIASAVLKSGDEVGARMAFRETYTRLLDEARRDRRPISWSVSLGHDPRLRDDAIAEAVRSGRVSANDYPQLAAPASIPMLTMQGTTPAATRARESLRELSERLKRPKPYVPSQDAHDKAAMAERKAEIAAKVQAYTEPGA